MFLFFFFQAEDGIRDDLVTGVQTCALPIFAPRGPSVYAAATLKTVSTSKFQSVMNKTPATATPTASHHPACTGLPPARTRRASTGRISGSLAARSVRPSALKGEMRRVRTSQDASATSTLAANAAYTR